MILGRRRLGRKWGARCVERRLSLLPALCLCAAPAPAAGQAFVYVEPGLAACPAAPVASSASPRTVRSGVALAGSIRVSCGFDKGSYTLSLSSSDPRAVFSPASFLVNFGRLSGDGAFAVTFATPGVHGVSVAITSNMGSPPVRGRFSSATSEFNVVPP